jgi:hypothetical protein
VSPELLSPRGTTTCRGCGETSLESVLDLGDQPLANELLNAQGAEHESFPLHLRICPRCALGQVGEFVLPERIFGDYPYLSSVSTSWLAHATKYAEQMQSHFDLKPSDVVVELASNDGYLLRAFQGLGIRVLGVEPARNVAAIAQSVGVPTISEFFGKDLGERIVAEHGHPRLVVANNVYAHVPDLDDFTAGLAALCDDDTVVTIENPSFMTLLQETQFDTIYHEHFSYLTAHSVAAAVRRHGLELVRVDQLPTHGGSNRYWLRRAGAKRPDSSVAETLASEASSGLLEPRYWQDFADRSTTSIAGLRRWLEERAADGSARVVGYGAAAKGNTLMNAAGVTRHDVIAIADGSPEKQGRFLPGSRIPVVAPDALQALGATDVLILPWNIAAEIAGTAHRMAPGARLWVCVPTMLMVSHP